MMRVKKVLFNCQNVFACYNFDTLEFCNYYKLSTSFDYCALYVYIISVINIITYDGIVIYTYDSLNI